MKSLLFVCEDSNSINRNSSQRLKPGNRWFFGETEIIDKQNSALNIPLDNHNYRKFELDQIITYDVDELSLIANNLAEQCFLNSSNNLVISTSYSFGNNCPLLLEGFYNDDNTLVGPGLFLLLSRNILSTIQDQDESNSISLYCSWTGVLNSGDFTDLFEDLNKENDSFDMENLSPISGEFGYTSIFKVESVNSLAAEINSKRKSSNWKEICHYIFTFRIYKDFNEIESGKNNQMGSISLISLGEGIKTRISGQISPWNALEMAMKEYKDPIKSDFCMLQFSRFISHYFEFPDLITIIYRFPFYINPMKLSHGKEIKFILSMMLFHQSFLNFISIENNVDSIQKDNYIVAPKSILSSSSNIDSQNSKYLQDFGYDSPIQIGSYKSSFFFNNELNDAPIPPPNPVSKNELDLRFQEDSSKYNIFIENGFISETSKIEEIYSEGNNGDPEGNISNLPTKKNLKCEYDTLIREIKMLENTILDKNEIIIRLEKLIDARDQIIKQNQETIMLLRQDLNTETTKVKELEHKIKMNKGDNFSNHLHNKKLPLNLQRARPSTVNNNLVSKNVACCNDTEIHIGKTQNKDENNVFQYTQDEAVLSPVLTGVAKMALEKFLRN
ncbi:hypothetical protein [Cryptosporidium parvum Iowa II]|uniref:Uncharacterized protein n=2 Tax=Cryptosporidium parvum TaxID=5807 RepID=Q5CTV6_CRYPI|nr:hypothetical protein [Cryptosporidium parvum Iowa II]EAK88828.1 hypothetical protein cgd2_1400 [Cryptosporidium parvum Iowa II]QOY43094.1 Uncharacterized protein CPATCC_0029430 [Cryptosporidium parvum]WRK30927.1 Uncharacterized protein cpbgf_2001400 [Cryptosporidium parvum]|eukprot:QOY43094.1 hypothetical protein CPATCC_000802 [Cryptosporidium parvum]